MQYAQYKLAAGRHRSRCLAHELRGACIARHRHAQSAETAAHCAGGRKIGAVDKNALACPVATDAAVAAVAVATGSQRAWHRKVNLRCACAVVEDERTRDAPEALGCGVR